MSSPHWRELTPNQQRRFDRLQSTQVAGRTDLRCGDCGAGMRLLLGPYGRFYGCTKYNKTGCKGKVGADDDGVVTATIANQQTREARKAIMELLTKIQTPLSPSHYQTGECSALTVRWHAIAGAAVVSPNGIGRLDYAACQKVLHYLTTGERPPSKDTRWDRLMNDDEGDYENSSGSF